MAHLPLKNADGTPRIEDGKQWYAVIVNYRDYTGRRRQVRKNAHGIDAARKVQRDFENKRDALDLADQKPPSEPEPEAARPFTVAEYLERWIAGRKGEIGESTLKRYREALAHVSREVGAVPLDALTTLQVKSVYESITASGLTTKTALNTHRTLKRALQDAIDIYGLITRNPAIKQVAPRADKSQPIVVSSDALDLILTAADATPIAPVVRLITLTGLRLGEALALTWNDVDLDNARLTVARTLNTYGALGVPKTDRSRRTIGISPETVSMLRGVHRSQAADKLAAGKAYTDSGFVFANVLGAPRTQWAVNHEWRRIIVAAEARRIELVRDNDKYRRVSVKGVRIHDLRHTHASHLLAAGWELSTVAERLGHSRTSTTLDFYSHALPSRNAELVSAVDTIFGVAK